MILGYPQQNALPDSMQLLVVLIYGFRGDEGMEGEWITDESAVDSRAHFFAQLFVVSNVFRLFHELFETNIKF